LPGAPDRLFLAGTHDLTGDPVRMLFLAVEFQHVPQTLFINGLQPVGGGDTGFRIHAHVQRSIA
jgi:hypothetical protein